MTVRLWGRVLPVPISGESVGLSDRIAIDVTVEAGDWSMIDPTALAETAVVAAVERSGVDIAAGPEVGVIFSDDDRLRELNGRHRGKDRATNVLSFPAAPPASDLYGPLLGDIVLAQETVLAEAEARGIAVADHSIHLIVHGFLHLIGFDHETDQMAVEMESLETDILLSIGVADPYAE